MLPFGGQGSNQAIEDGGVLGRVLAGVQDAAGLPQRLELFDKLRVRRASRIQILSSVRANNEHLVQDQIAQYMEPGVPRRCRPWLPRVEADADIMMTFSTQLIPWTAGSRCSVSHPYPCCVLWIVTNALLLGDLTHWRTVRKGFGN